MQKARKEKTEPKGGVLEGGLIGKKKKKKKEEKKKRSGESEQEKGVKSVDVPSIRTYVWLRGNLHWDGHVQDAGSKKKDRGGGW